MFITKSFAKFIPQFSKSLYLFGSIKKFYLPDLGEKIKEATVKKWHVKVGDQVEEFQELADVSTDKMFTAITSAYKGKIAKIFHKEDDICQIGELLIEFEIDEQEGTTTTQASATPSKSETTITQTTQQQQQQQTQTSSTQQQSSKALIAPAVRRLVKENNLNINQVVGTGKDGRILKQDVLNFLNQKSVPTQQQKQQQQPSKVQPPITSVGEKIDKQTIQMNDYQKGMQKSMTYSNTIPHFYIMEEIDVSEISKVREKINKDSTLKITYMPFFMKAFSLALFDYPIMNSTYDIEKPFQYTTYKNHNISVAIDSPNGLVVPNIKNCQNLSILQIQEELNRLRRSAEAARVASKDIQDGTVCISNVGNICGTYTGPLIMPPQVCIAGIGRMQDLPRFANNKSKEVVSKKILTTSFGCDHRVLDGATSARFLQKWKSYLENPSNFLLALR